MAHLKRKNVENDFNRNKSSLSHLDLSNIPLCYRVQG
jgi:hypothetical protein